MQISHKRLSASLSARARARGSISWLKIEARYHSWRIAFISRCFPRSNAVRKEWRMLRGAFSLSLSSRHSERCPSTMGPAGTLSSGVSPWWYCSFRGLNTPSVSDRWAVEGVLRNYYAITHKPIDLDWTPGGVLRAFRFVTRSKTWKSARRALPADRAVRFSRQRQIATDALGRKTRRSYTQQFTVVHDLCGRLILPRESVPFSWDCSFCRDNSAGQKVQNAVCEKTRQMSLMRLNRSSAIASKRFTQFGARKLFARITGRTMVREAGRHECGVLRNQFYTGLTRARMHMLTGVPEGFPMRASGPPKGCRAHPNSASRSASVSLVSKSINNLYHLVHSTKREPICTCVSPYRGPAGAPFSFAQWQESPRPHTGCTDKLYGFDTNGLAGSDVLSAAEIGRVQVLTRFHAASRARLSPSFPGIYIIYL